jgi:hypothetical protein
MERLAWDKYSSLFDIIMSDEEKSFMILPLGVNVTICIYITDDNAKKTTVFALGNPFQSSLISVIKFKDYELEFRSAFQMFHS